ncbi:U3 small nucleolar ribonucleoprotein complex, subunit Mpp10 [Cunninghamella echinulata]|nr:U3 small nucleolar ribonucleoprotein complex, subunit Mpp10 [Cunninghamella echinulata]
MVAKSTSKKSVTDEYIKDVINKPQVFFSVNPKITEKSIALTKHLYDTAKQYEVETMSPFTELLTEGFDQDQIWEELASQNEPFLRYCKSTLKQWSKPTSWSKKNSTNIESFSSSDNSTAGEEDGDEEDLIDYDMDEEEEGDMDMLDLEEDNEKDIEEEEESQDDDEEEEEEEEEEKENDDDNDDDIVNRHLSTPKKTSEVDDEFFNLDDFNKWTDEQEALDMRSDQDSDDDDEEKIDFDNDLDAMDDEDMDDEDDDAADISYKDFFLPPNKPKKQVKFSGKDKYNEEDNDDQDLDDEFMDDDEAENDDDDDDDNDDQPIKTKGLFDDDEEEGEDGAKKSAHQRQLDRVQSQIEQFEQENLEGRHWTLKGEASAKARPVNSLLEEDLEFDHSVKPVPVITQETTNVLEDMIKKRILDDDFNDVERKEDPTLRPFLPSKRVELVDTQAKKSLADLYEEEYVKKNTGDQSNAKDEALEKEHNEISTMFQDLCEKLDSLSNFHFTPKQAKAEMTIVSNAASISMEEVIPVNVSDGTLLAPEEVYDKKQGEVKDKSEMDQNERRKERKQKKLQKRKERDLKEKERQLIQKSKPSGSFKETKQSKTKAVKELLGQKNVTLIGKDGKKLKQDKHRDNDYFFQLMIICFKKKKRKEEEYKYKHNIIWVKWYNYQIKRVIKITYSE